MSEPATVMFGLGAAKAGSTWLFDYLSGHPDCHFRTIKELHYFDALDRRRAGMVLRQTKRQHERVEERAKLATDPAKLAVLDRKLADLRDYQVVLGKDQADHAAYLDYLSKGRGAAHLVGDITPAYAMLSAERYGAMAALAPVVKFVFLLRDPVERLWSQIRMVARHDGRSEAARARAADALIDGYVAGRAPQFADRSDYAATLTRLRAAVPAANLFVGFYERLFSPETLASLCAFLGIRPHTADFSKRVHEGRGLDLTPARWRVLRDALAPQYDYVREMMQGDLPAEWQSQMAEV